MSAKHTQGPWDPAANWPPGMSMVCHHDGSGWRPVADCAVSGDAAEANARLIAAAPELLEALKLAEPYVRAAGKLFHLGDDLKRVQAAIAKATGGAA